MSEGTRIAIRDPYYKVYMDGTSGIRVDNPADIVFLDDTRTGPMDPERPNFEQQNSLGNDAFRCMSPSSAAD